MNVKLDLAGSGDVDHQKELTKALREVTGCYTMECKRALMLFNWDFMEAKAYLQNPVNSVGILRY
jgi:translation elongation factor EF-Ts